MVRDQRTEGRWELRTGEHGVPAGLAIEIDGDQVTGEGPCNGFSASWSPDAGASQLLSTAMGCAPPVVRAEETFFQLLEAGTVEVEDNRLHLRSSGVDLVFDRVDER
ncbi:META domain-containing protein [Nocardioides nanhaiensis]|uniref:META domain-containing protein n=1 Tax=Nocardioides nanhaiensis TaxID=1476871 RepID=UPI0031EEC318